MCCTQDSKPIFKGVVVLTTTIILAILNIIPCCDSRSLSSAKAGNSYCVYLEKSQELDCICPDQEFDKANHVDSAPITFPTEDFLLSAENKSVASLKLNSCRGLKVRLDLRPLQRPFYRLRLEDIHDVVIESILLLPSDNIDIFIRNINGSLSLSGSVTCLECSSKNPQTFPTLTLHLFTIRDVSMTEVYFQNIQPKINVRDTNSLVISQSFFKNVTENAVQITNVPNVLISRSEFGQAEARSIALERVGNVTVANSIVERNVIHLDSGADDNVITWTCNSDGNVTIDPTCVLSPGLPQRVKDLNMGGSGSAVALSVAVVSAVILLVAIGVLIFLHRSGKLEQYI